jgi:hypothetical protein
VKNNILSIDTLILFLATLSVIKLVPAKVIAYPILLLLLGIYVLIDLLNTRDEDTVYRYKFTVIILIVFLLAVVPCLHRISLRHHSKPHHFAHDGGVILTEEAVKYFLNGKNPYHEDYYGTALEDYYTVYKLGDIKNSVIQHYTYLPLTFILTLPFYVLSKAILGWFDMRFIYLLMFIIYLFILPKLTNSNQNKALLLTIFALNPFFTNFIAAGRNDVFLLFWIILSVFFLTLDKPRTASAFLGFACVSKLTAWCLIPFFLTYLLNKDSESVPLTQKISFLFKQAYPLVLIIIILILPFLIWDVHSFTEDIFNWDEAYPLGGTPGFGFANLMLYTGYSKSDYFPFKYLQLILGLPLLYFLIKRQLKNNTINLMLVNYGFLSLTLLYFSRFLHDNYIGYVFSIFCLAFFANKRNQQEMGNIPK